RAEVKVLDAEEVLVGRGEKAADCQRSAARCEAQEAVAVIDSRQSCFESSVTGDRDQIAVGVDAETASGLPDAAVGAVGRGVVDDTAGQRGLVVAENTPMVRAEVAVRREAQIDDAAGERQRRAIVLLERIE